VTALAGAPVPVPAPGRSPRLHGEPGQIAWQR